jgi:L-fucose mutarotase/ribose pyranase (RbsD/FucU family)
MTEPLYHHDAYLAAFDANVTAAHPDGVVLADGPVPAAGTVVRVIDIDGLDRQALDAAPAGSPTGA